MHYTLVTMFSEEALEIEVFTRERGCRRVVQAGRNDFVLPRVLMSVIPFADLRDLDSWIRCWSVANTCLAEDWSDSLTSAHPLA